MTGKNLIRGLRNNNPFNIRKSRQPWIGKIHGSDPEFETFRSMYLGIRAGVKLLLTYVDRGIDTPSAIISRFAPSCENNTSAYLDFVCRNSTGVYWIAKDERITKLRQLAMLASRMAKYECALGTIQQINLSLDADGIMSVIKMYNLKTDLK